MNKPRKVKEVKSTALNFPLIVIFLLSLFLHCPLVFGDQLDKLLSEQVTALGGLEKIRNIESYYLKASIEVGGMTGEAFTYYKSPDKFKTEIVLPLLSIRQIRNGDHYWIQEADGLVYPLEHSLKAIFITSYSIATYTYLDKEKFIGSLEILTTDTLIDSISCYLLRVQPIGGVAAELAVNKATDLPYQIAVKSDLAIIYSQLGDYRTVAGIQFPFRTKERSEAGFVSAISKIQEIKFNLHLSDSLFSIPTQSADINNTDIADSVVIPVDIWGNHLFIDVRIDSSRELNFIFDTGAAGIGINNRLQNQLSLQKLGSAEARGVGGAEKTDIYQVDKIALAGIELSDIPCYLIDFTTLEKSSNLTIDGIIGYDILSRYIVQVNYHDSVLILFPKNTKPEESWGCEQELIIDFRLPYITSVVNDSLEGKFRLDTGSHSSIDFNAPFVKDNKLLSKDWNEYHQVISYGVGGSTRGLIGILDNISICDYVFDSIIVNYSLAQTGVFAGENTAGNIGSGLLKAFTVTFDYNRQKVYFAKSDYYDLVDNIRNMAGITIEVRNDKYIIAGVNPGGVSDGTLIAGDELLEIDDYKIKGLKLQKINDLLMGRSGSVLQLTILRNNQKLTKNIVLRNLY